MADHLRPAPSSICNRMASSYMAEASRLLMPVDDWSLYLVSLPSFEPEEAVYVLENQHGPQVISTRMKSLFRPIMMGHRSPSLDASSRPAINVARSPIDPSLLESLRRLWNAALVRTRYRSGNDVHTDGTNHHFGARSREFGIMAGMTWSPLPDSLMGGLVEVGEKLARYAREPETQRARSAEELRQESTRLLQRFESEDSRILP